MEKKRLILPLVMLLLSGLACTFGQPPADQTLPSLPPSNETAPTSPASATPLPPPADPGAVIQPEDLEYLGAFRLPDDGDRPRTFEYGGNAMTFRPGSQGDNDGFPGSLFITGHDRLAYGELTDGSQLAEVSIPVPVRGQLDALNTAEFVQGFQDVAAGHFRGLDEIPRIGLAYLDHPVTGPKITEERKMV